MPRPTILIDKTALESIINDAESKNTFPNISALCEHVCSTEWAKGLKNSAGKPAVLQPQVVRNRIDEFKLSIKTVKGKKGNPGLSGVKRDRKPRAERFSTNELVTKSLNTIRTNTPHGFKKVVDRISAGSLKAAVRLKCLDCVNYQQAEIGTEACLSCPLAPFVFVKLSKFKKGEQDDSE